MNQEDNGVHKRLREVEMRLEGHISEYGEFKKRIDDHFKQNTRDHCSVNTHLDKMDRTLKSITLKVAAIVGGASAAATLAMWLFGGKQ